MRNGQNNKRMRGRNNSNNSNRRGQNPMTRVFESNGPDIKIRGTASHIAEKYVQLARDARGSGDPVASENYYQHAEHYFRLIAATAEQYRQNQPQQQPRSDFEVASDSEDGDSDGYSSFGAEPASYRAAAEAFPPRERQTRPACPAARHQPRDTEQPREEQPAGEQAYRESARSRSRPAARHGVDRLPSFFTGTQPQPGSGLDAGCQPASRGFAPPPPPSWAARRGGRSNQRRPQSRQRVNGLLARPSAPYRQRCIDDDDGTRTGPSDGISRVCSRAPESRDKTCLVASTIWMPATGSAKPHRSAPTPTPSAGTSRG